MRPPAGLLAVVELMVRACLFFPFIMIASRTCAPIRMKPAWQTQSQRFHDTVLDLVEKEPRGSDQSHDICISHGILAFRIHALPFVSDRGKLPLAYVGSHVIQATSRAIIQRHIILAYAGHLYPIATL